MSTIHTASTFRFNLRRFNDTGDQSLLIRLGFVHRHLFRSPSATLPYNIFHESMRIPMRTSLFPLPLRQLQDPLICYAYILQLLSCLNITTVNYNLIAKDITYLVGEVLAVGNVEVKFTIVAEIDLMQMFWIDRIGESRRSVVVAEETVILEEAPEKRLTSAEKAIEREKFDGFGEEETGECCICYEELKEEGKEVCRIKCGHVYHKHCILTWVQINDSCPLCRMEIK